MLKLKVGWGLRARRYEERISIRRAGSIARKCMTEKKHYGWKDRWKEKKRKVILIESAGRRKKRRGQNGIRMI